MRDRIRKRTKYLTVSAMLCALSVIILMLGSVFDVLDITAAMAASLLCVYAVIEIGGAYPWMLWLATSVLSLLLLPVKTPALFYALFAGFYPILKEKLEKLKWKRPILMLLKLASFHISLIAVYFGMRLFVPAQLEFGDAAWLPILLYVMCVACFFLFDLALTRLITFYLIRLRNKFRIK